MGHTGYPGMGAPQGYPGAAQAWGYNPQGWGAPDQAQHAQAPAGQVQINPATGQPDYSQQWIEYYRYYSFLIQKYVNWTFENCCIINYIIMFL